MGGGLEEEEGHGGQEEVDGDHGVGLLWLMVLVEHLFGCRSTGRRGGRRRGGRRQGNCQGTSCCCEKKERVHKREKRIGVYILFLVLRVGLTDLFMLHFCIT